MFNKDEMIDVTSGTRGHGYKGSYPLELHQVAEEDTPQSQEERVYWNVAFEPVFSGKCAVQVNSGFHHQDVQHEVHGGKGMPESLVRR